MFKLYLYIPLIFLFLASCTQKSNQKSLPRKKAQLINPIISHQAINDTLVDSIPLISGSCALGREIGDMKLYNVKMKIGPSSTDSIQVRSNAASFSHDYKGNVLGKIKSGTIIFGHGPLKNRGFSAGIGYAFPVKDKTGKVCRGYISFLNVEITNSNY